MPLPNLFGVKTGVVTSGSLYMNGVGKSQLVMSGGVEWEE